MSMLRAKLAAMNSNKPIRPASRAGLRVVTGECAAPEFDSIEAATLARMGFNGEWPGADGLLFLDTETTGLAGGAGTIIFLLGAGYFDGGRFVTEQYLLGDYCDEAEMIARLCGLLSRFQVLVTFNGDAFDIPLMWSRATMMRMSNEMTALTSYDLLKPSRRLWKKRLGSVRLSVLESEILRRGRTDDLPGSEAPKRFFDYLKTGDRALVDPVVEHNRLDVISMAYLLKVLFDAYRDPSKQKDPVDLMSMALSMERVGDRQAAMDCYETAAKPRSVNSVNDLRFKRVQGSAQYSLGIIYKRSGDFGRARECFEKAVLQGDCGSRSMVELAKILEHREGDYERAFEWTMRAISAETDEAKLVMLENRARRLKNKLKNGGIH